MSIYYYTLKNNDQYQEVFDSIRNIKLDSEPSGINKIEIINDINNLSIRSGDIIILYADNISDIDFYIRNIEILNNCRIILILSKYNKEIIRKAHILRPRYIEYIGDGLAKVSKVINKIVTKYALTSEMINSSRPFSKTFAQGGIS
jgi:hypothetical protein